MFDNCKQESSSPLQALSLTSSQISKIPTKKKSLLHTLNNNFCFFAHKNPKTFFMPSFILFFPTLTQDDNK